MRSLNLLSQFTTAARPSGNCKVNVAPRTRYDTCWAGMTEPLVVDDPVAIYVAVTSVAVRAGIGTGVEVPGHDIRVIRLVILAIDYCDYELLC
jgi:hypothetical protein